MNLGGIYVGSGDVTIVDSEVVDNRAWWGGGLSVAEARVTLRNVQVARNVASRGGGIGGGPYGAFVMEGGRLEDNLADVGEGGGASFGSYGSHAFAGVTISGNSATSHGGGVYTSGYASVSFTRCRVAGNTAASFGGGAVGWNGELSFDRTVVEGNAAGTGGGVAQNSAYLTLVNSVVRNNTAEAAGGVLVKAARAHISHATITGNVTTSTADGSGAGGVERTSTYIAWVSMVNSIAWGNRRGTEASDVAGLAAGEVTSSDVGVGATPGVDGNFSADPAFVPGDCHLAAGSPCRDAGADLGNIWYAGADIDGDPRPLAAGGDGLPDVGADEFRPPSDAIPPVTQPTLAGTPGLNGWFISPVTVTLTATDEGGSGVATTEYSFDGQAWTVYAGSFEIAAEGVTTLWYRSTDGAGNAEDPRPASVQVDLTPPAVSITTPASGAAYVLRERVVAGWTASDAVSGLASASGTAASGAAVDTATVGAKAFIVAAADVAGLSASKQTLHEVRYVFGGFLPPLSANGTSVVLRPAPAAIKFQLLDALGALVPTATGNVFVAPVVNGVVGPESPAVAQGGSSSGNLVRWDARARQYVFDLATRTLALGVWQVRVALDDGTSRVVRFTLR